VRKQATARIGEIVACRIGEEATVKTLHKTGDPVVLKPENADYDLIHVKAGEDFEILGKVVGVYRKL